MNYKELIIKWHDKASRDKDIFSRFVFEYLSFIAILSKYVFPGRKQDWELIRDLKNDEQIKNIYLNNLDEDTKNAWKAIIDELDESPIGLGNLGNFEIRDNNYWDTRDGKTSGTIEGLDDWENMINFIYTIRNNLFHGAKSPEVKRDQLLIEKGYIVLKPLVDILIEECLNAS